MFCECNNQLKTYSNNPYNEIPCIKYQTHEINKQIHILQQWFENKQDIIDDDTDTYFDCIEGREFDTYVHDLLYRNTPIELSNARYYPWISELQLAIHRKTSLLRRFLNYFNQSRKCSWRKLVEEFIRINRGRFCHPIGSRFHISYGNEKWLLILKNVKFLNYPTYPYPKTRIIFIRKGILYVVR